ncbi:MAG: hypothetical protein QW201_02010 [Thermoproteota archaeon]
MQAIKKIMVLVLVCSMVLVNVYCDGESSGDVFTRILQNIVSEVENAVKVMSSMVLSTALRILGILYAPMALVGIILYATRIDRYLGKELLGGALLLAFFAEFVLPALLHTM